MSKEDKLSQIIKDFILESMEGIGTITSSLTELEKHPEKLELVNEIYRAMHTLKGSACFFQFGKLEKITHILENLLGDIRDEGKELTANKVDFLLESLDEIQSYLETIENTSKEPEGPSDHAISFMKGLSDKHSLKLNEDLTLENLIQETSKVDEPLISNEALNENPSETLEVNDNQVSKDPLSVNVSDVEVSKNLIDDNNESLNEINETVGDDETVEVSSVENENVIELKEEAPLSNNNDTLLDEQAFKLEPSNAEPSIEAKELSAPSKIMDSVVRVNVKLLDKIMNVAGELVLNRNQILQFANSTENPDLIRLASQLDIITTELQSDIMTTRMQPVGNVLNKFERVVRDVARQNNKKVEVRIYGKDTELDKTLLEAVKDPLTHIVRNSVDHGIEPPEERVKNGKDEVGLLEIKAYHESGHVIIDIIDDGRGLSLDKIKKKAISSGLYTEIQIENLSDKEIQNLIFHPGLSTAEKVTNISGRGVGMDVVKTNIEKIGGLVDLNSAPGEGTTITLKIPLTLAIIPALIVKGCSDYFAVPQNNIVELVRVDDDSRLSIELAYGSEFLRLRGELIPLIRLNKILGLKEESQNFKSKDVSFESSQNLERPIGNYENSTQEKVSLKKSENIVVLNSEGRIYGIIVDDILDTQEIVVKAIGFHNKSNSVFAGSTIMGDGSVALILDAIGVAQYSGLQMKNNKSDKEKVGNERSLSESHSYLMFSLDKNEASSFAIPLSLVHRLEEFSVESIEQVGAQKVVQYREGIMPLVYVANEVKSSHDFQPEELVNVFVVNIHNQIFGMVVNEILDIVEITRDIDSNVTDNTNISGSFFLGEKAVTVIDVFNIVDSLQFMKNVEKKFKKRSEKILVVEDSPMFRKMSVELLKDSGFEVIEAIDGQDALDKLEADPHMDLILSDIEMPNLNGFEMAEVIKTKSALKNIPLVAVTTKFSSNDIERGKQCGFDFYLEKFNKDEILSVIDHMFKKAS